jgi:hypothetical protein
VKEASWGILLRTRCSSRAQRASKVSGRQRSPLSLLLVVVIGVVVVVVVSMLMRMFVLTLTANLTPVIAAPRAGNIMARRMVCDEGAVISGSWSIHRQVPAALELDDMGRIVRVGDGDERDVDAPLSASG